MSAALAERIAPGLTREVDPAVRAFAEMLGREAGAVAVLFYGSNLRTGSLDGVLDFYVLLPGEDEARIWPTVSYREWQFEGTDLRAKIATMTLAKFAEAASGSLLDTTIWARFVQPSALIWSDGETARQGVIDAIASATVTAARLAVAVGPKAGSEDAFWLALFRATYKAEFRVETSDRAQSILDLNEAHFAGLLVPALEAAGIAYSREDATIRPALPEHERRRILGWWARRRRAGKALNLTRLVKASRTFDGAARYAAWKVERHTGVPVEVTPWREKHPVLAAPGVMLSVWRKRRKGQT
ncbi:MAG: hypothetical protein R3D89_11270 [Sphingomonadaceae bacterium]|jgi:hypothetical protein